MAREAKGRRQPRERKPSLGRRVGEGLNSLGEFGRSAVTDPRGLPRQAEGVFRRWFRKVWAVRGGGLYATGFAAMFLYLEVVEIVTDDLPTLLATDLLSSAVVGLIISFVVDTFVNFVSALIWPVYVIAFAPPWGMIGLGLGYLVFDRFLTPRVEAWMNRDDAVASEPLKESGEVASARRETS